jgi:uncharacterized protein
MSIAVLILHIRIPGCASLKAKRSSIQPLLAKIHNSYNVSIAEYALQDIRDESILACAVISNDPTHNRQVLTQVEARIDRDRPDLEIIDSKIELL